MNFLIKPLDIIPTSETGYFEGFKMIIRYKPFLILTIATVASVLATQVNKTSMPFSFSSNTRLNSTSSPFKVCYNST
jgi:Na+/melibiose symporter-like transporter